MHKQTGLTANREGCAPQRGDKQGVLAGRPDFVPGMAGSNGERGKHHVDARIPSIRSAGVQAITYCMTSGFVMRSHRSGVRVQLEPGPCKHFGSKDGVHDLCRALGRHHQSTSSTY